MTYREEVDPIWGLPSHSTAIGSGLTQYSSDRAGRFATSEGLSGYLRDWSDGDKAKLTTRIIDHNRGGDAPVTSPDVMRTMRDRRSLGFVEKVDRLLLILEADKYRPGHPLPWRGGVETQDSIKPRHRAMARMEAANEQEFNAFRVALIDASILINDGANDVPRLASHGYERLDALRATASLPIVGSLRCGSETRSATLIP